MCRRIGADMTPVTSSSLTAAMSHRARGRLIVVAIAALVVGIVSILAISELRHRVERSREAQLVIGEIRLDTTALAAMELVAAGQPTARPLLAAQRAESSASLEHGVGRLAALIGDAGAAKVGEAADAFTAELERAQGDVGAMADPLGSAPYLAWFRLDGALAATDARADARATSAGRAAEIGTWIIIGLAGLVIAVLAGRLAAERSRTMRLGHEARTDALTGLANQRAFRDAIEDAVAVASRDDSAVSLVLIDVDRFKGVNDTHGHQVGDAVLVEVARRLAPIVRTGDLLARLGGDEFAWLIHGCNRDGAKRAAEIALEALRARPFEVAGDIGASLGVASTDVGYDAGAIVEAADAALYRAKRGGRGRVDLATVDVPSLA